MTKQQFGWSARLTGRTVSNAEQNSSNASVGTWYNSLLADLRLKADRVEPTSLFRCQDGNVGSRLARSQKMNRARPLRSGSSEHVLCLIVIPHELCTCHCRPFLYLNLVWLRIWSRHGLEADVSLPGRDRGAVGLKLLAFAAPMRTDPTAN